MKKKVTFTLEESSIEELKAISEKTMIPQSRLVEKAIMGVIAEHELEERVDRLDNDPDSAVSWKDIRKD